MKSKSAKDIIADLIEILIIGVAVFAIAWIFLAEPVEVTGESMYPTLLDKEQLIVEKVSMNFGEVERGDIVVFNSPEQPEILVIKRVIALPGDSVMLSEGNVILNGNTLIEDYLAAETSTRGKLKLKEGESVKVPDGTIFVLGDNRGNSTDSRDFGPISQDSIVGTAYLIYYPMNEFRIV